MVDVHRFPERRRTEARRVVVVHGPAAVGDGVGEEAVEKLLRLIRENGDDPEYVS